MDTNNDIECFLYKITCKVNGKVYIGRTTKSLKQRLSAHISGASCIKNRSYNTKLSRAIRKYGECNFSITLLKSVIGWENSGMEEIDLIKKYNAITKGYNITKGGGGTLGYTHSLETKKKLQLLAVGRKRSEETKKKMSVSKMGHPVSAETKRKQKLSHTYKAHTPEALLKMSLIHKGKVISDKRRLQISVRMSGVGNPQSKGILSTPSGKFSSSREASKFLNVSDSTIRRRCRSESSTWKSWYYENHSLAIL